MSDAKSAFGFDPAERKDSIPDLVRQLTEQGAHLAQQQVSLVQAEVKDSINDLKVGAGAMAGAAVVGIAGLGVLLMALAFLLDEVMQLWLATLIVAAVTLGIAYAMFASGKKKMQSNSMSVERTRRTLERAPSAIAGHSEGAAR
jgi:hypothetical protein